MHVQNLQGMAPERPRNQQLFPLSVNFLVINEALEEDMQYACLVALHLLRRDTPIGY